MCTRNRHSRLTEDQVYHRFDCHDPDARAPTPLPPQFPQDLELEYEAEKGHDESGIVTETPSLNSLFDEVTGPSPGVSPELPNVMTREVVDARVAEEQLDDSKRAEVEAPKRAITPPPGMKKTVAPVPNQTPFNGKDKIKMKKVPVPAKVKSTTPIPTKTTLATRTPPKTTTPVPTETTQSTEKTTAQNIQETMQVSAKTAQFPAKATPALTQTTPAPTQTTPIPMKTSPSSDELSEVPSGISAPPSVSFGYIRVT